MVRYILTLLILLAGLTVNAKKWYVATAANGGSDVSGNGSITKPWASINHAVDTVRGVNFVGDTIFVNAGKYTETDSISLTPGVSLMGEGIISHIEFTYADSLYTNACILLVSTSEATAGNQSISYLKLDGGSTAYHGILVRCRTNVIIHDVTIIDFKFNAVNFNGKTTGFALTGTDAPTNYSTGNKLYNCILTNNCNKIYTFLSSGYGQLRFTGQEGFEVYNNIFTQTGAAAGFNGNNVDARQGTSKNIKFHDNTFYKPSTNGSDWNFHVESWDAEGGYHFYNNIFYEGCGIDAAGHYNEKGAYDYAWYIHDNQFINAAQIAFQDEEPIGICLEGSVDSTIITRNYFKRKSSGVTMSAKQAGITQHDIFINYNIFSETGFNNQNSWHMFLSGSDVGNTQHDIYIDNNVFVGNGIRKTASVLFFNLSAAMECTDIYFRNNIVKNVSIVPIYVYNCAVGDIYSQNNCFYDVGDYTDNVRIVTGSIANWTYSGAVIGDPLFTSTSNFRLQSISPAINKGINVSLTTDYDGNPIVGIPDIGAFEYQTLPVATTGLGWEDHLAKRNFKDDVNFAGRWMIDAIPVTATAAELNALVGRGQIISGLDTIHLSNRINSKADTSLSNLSSVAINTHLLPDTAGTINLGSGAKPFAKIFGGSTIVSDLSIGDSASNTITKFDSVAVFNGKLYAFVNGDTIGWGVLTADSEDITDHVIMKIDTVNGSSNNDYVYSKYQIDTMTFAGFTSGFDSVYIYAKVDSLINVVGEQQSQIDLLWAAIDSLGLGDFNPPTFLSAEVGTFNDSILVVILNDTDIQQDSIPAAGAFTVKENGSAMGIEAIDIGNDTVYISLDALAIEGYTYTVSYNKDYDYPQLQDSSENITPSWTNRTVTNNVFDAFPSIVSVTETLTNSTDRTSHPITMPASVDEGDLLLVFFACDFTSVSTLSIDAANSDDGWTLESYDTEVNTVGHVVLWKVADADGDTLTITTSESQISVAQTYRITNFDPSDPVKTTYSTGANVSQYPDPPANTGDYGADDYLWIVSYGADSGASYATAAPADFTGLETTYVDSSGSCSLNSAYRKYNVNGAYNPGTFTANTTDEEWVSNTVIVNPIQ